MTHHHYYTPRYPDHPHLDPHNHLHQHHPHPSALAPSEAGSKITGQLKRSNDTVEDSKEDNIANASTTSNPPRPPSNSGGGTTNPLRKKIAQNACEHCRKKRTRCVTEPGKKICTACIALGIECHYSGVDKRRESVRDLRTRLSELEALVDTLRLCNEADAARYLERIRDGEEVTSIVASMSAAGNGLAKKKKKKKGQQQAENGTEAAPTDGLPGPSSAKKRRSNSTVSRTSQPVVKSDEDEDEGEAEFDEAGFLSALANPDTSASKSGHRRKASMSTTTAAAAALSALSSAPITSTSANGLPINPNKRPAPQPSPPPTANKIRPDSAMSNASESTYASDGHQYAPIDLANLVDNLHISPDGSICAYGPMSNLSFTTRKLDTLPGTEYASTTSDISGGLLGTPTNNGKPRSETGSGMALSNASGSPAAPPHPQLQPQVSLLHSVSASAESAHHHRDLLAQRNQVAVVPHGTTINTVQHLLNLYFLWHHSFFTIMSRTTFVSHLCNGGKYCSPLLLNAILALASQFSDWTSIRTLPNDPHTAGDEFFKMSKELLDKELDNPTITTVQALALMAKREAMVGREARGWLYMGMCCRLTLDLGLHLDASSLVERGILSDEDIYVRSRTFWGIFVIDKEFSAINGRPSSIRDMVMTCPAPVYSAYDDFDWWASFSGGQILPANDKNRGTMHNFPLLVRCAETFDDGMHTLYFKVSATAKTRLVREVQANMRACKAEIVALCPIKSSKMDLDPSTPQTCLLHLVCEGGIIFLNRPFLPKDAASAASTFDDPDSPRNQCFSAAKRVVEITSIFKSATSHGLRMVLYCQMHILAAAATILIWETKQLAPDVLQGSMQSPALRERKKLAKRLLEEEAIPFIKEMAVYRRAGEHVLQTLHAHIASVDSRALTLGGQGLGSGLSSLSNTSMHTSMADLVANLSNRNFNLFADTAQSQSLSAPSHTQQSQQPQPQPQQQEQQPLPSTWHHRQAQMQQQHQQREEQQQQQQRQQQILSQPPPVVNSNYFDSAYTSSTYPPLEDLTSSTHNNTSNGFSGYNIDSDVSAASQRLPAHSFFPITGSNAYGGSDDSSQGNLNGTNHLQPPATASSQPSSTGDELKFSLSAFTGQNAATPSTLGQGSTSSSGLGGAFSALTSFSPFDFGASMTPPSSAANHHSSTASGANSHEHSNAASTLNQQHSPLNFDAAFDSAANGSASNLFYNPSDYQYSYG